MTYAELYARGTKMSEVPPLTRGVPVFEYWRANLTEQCNETLAERARELEAAGKEPPLSGKRLWTPRDDYGIKGV